MVGEILSTIQNRNKMVDWTAVCWNNKNENGTCFSKPAIASGCCTNTDVIISVGLYIGFLHLDYTWKAFNISIQIQEAGAEGLAAALLHPSQPDTACVL